MHGRYPSLWGYFQTDGTSRTKESSAEPSHFVDDVLAEVSTPAAPAFPVEIVLSLADSQRFLPSTSDNTPETMSPSL
jgi:hypothetical protein